jgi:hypothetical protein
MTMQSKGKIHRGDFIEVEHRDENGAVDLLVRGTALTDLHIGGTSLFSVRPPAIGATQPPDLHLNCNYVDVRKLFDAHTLEGTEPTA